MTIYDTDSLFDLDPGPWAYDFESGYWATYDGRVARPAMLTPGKVLNRWTKELIDTNYFYPAKWIKFKVNPKGYQRLCTRELIHRVVARAWLPQSDKPYVNHKNMVKTDNRVENLEWVTASENAKHKYDEDPVYRELKRKQLVARNQLGKLPTS